MTDVCVVVPTVRNPECVREYAANARRHGFDTDRLHVVLVTEDFCDADAMRAMLDDEGLDGRVFDGSAREAWYAEHGIERFSHLVPAASHAQTSFGLLYLWANDFPTGFFIDDDTAPHPEDDFFGMHLANLEHEGKIEVRRSDERWVNVLDDTPTDLYPRGYPYAAMDETVERRTGTVGRVVASQGLWTDVPDLDTVRILMDGDLQGQAQTRLAREDFDDEPFVADRGQYLTVCSMNLAFRREVVPAFYQLPMDDNPWEVGRFDDIWSGVFLKRACDAVGSQILTGGPLCEHDKAPRSTFSDLQNEVAGLELNEHVWEVVDDADVSVEGDGPEAYATAFRGMADELAEGEFDGYVNGEFLNHVGDYMRDWLDCLEALRPTAEPTLADD